jgi:hypothetical protein
MLGMDLPNSCLILFPSIFPPESEVLGALVGGSGLDILSLVLDKFAEVTSLPGSSVSHSREFLMGVLF